MSVSDIDLRRQRLLKTALGYLAVSVACGVMGAVYETFSFGVYSPFMLYAFAFPLAGGALPFLLLGLFSRRSPGSLARRLYHFGIAALTVGSFVQGALEIYGTTSALVRVYWIAGPILSALGILLYALGFSSVRTRNVPQRTDPRSAAG